MIKKPLLIFDGECGFCRFWVYRLRFLTQDRMDYAPYQDVSHQFPQIPIASFQKAVQLVTPDGPVYQAAEAAFQAMAVAPSLGWALWLYTHVPGFGRLAEAVYRFIAAHRPLFARLTYLLWGRDPTPDCYVFSRWFFLRLLGCVYVIAFLSFWVQAEGLVGSRGILPMGEFLSWVKEKAGLQRFIAIPTVFWLNASDSFLQAVCGLGTLCAVLLIFGFASVLMLAVLWILYLSLLTVSGVFLSFQWDILLLETGFLAVFLAPLELRPNLAREAGPPALILWVFRWLLFRLMLASGLVKLASGDQTWRSLTALSFHYETQPLPHWLSWYAHQLPLRLHKLSTMAMFAIELAVPFLFFAPRRLRLWGCGITAIFQLSIILTGNYCFFNLLTIALCFLIMGDYPWSGFFRQKKGEKRARAWPRWLLVPVAAYLVVASCFQMSMRFGIGRFWPSSLTAVFKALAPFHLTNNYGLFAVMTTSRPEIHLEGSNDGQAWLRYEFKYKPGDVKKRPAFVAPHQPRLDWQMWFAALGTYEQNPWLLNLGVRLLQGSPPVLAFFSKNPFPGEPPRYLRAVVEDYRFTNFKTRKETGAWWQAEPKGLYFPVISLREK